MGRIWMTDCLSITNCWLNDRIWLRRQGCWTSRTKSLKHCWISICRQEWTTTWRCRQPRSFVLMRDYDIYEESVIVCSDLELKLTNTSLESWCNFFTYLTVVAGERSSLPWARWFAAGVWSSQPSNERSGASSPPLPCRARWLVSFERLESS